MDPFPFIVAGTIAAIGFIAGILTGWTLRGRRDRRRRALRTRNDR